MASAREVAALAQLSRSQVSNYFNNPKLVSAEATERIRAAIEQLGYVRNESARQLRVGSSNMLGLLLLDAWVPFFAEMSREIEDEAERRGWHVQFANSNRDERRENRHLDFFEARRVQGLIIVPQGDVSLRLKRLRDNGIATVLLDPPNHHPVPDFVPSIAVDHIAGGAMAADHLLRRGSERFAFVGNPHLAKHSANRLAGFRAQLLARLPEARLSVIHTDDLTIGDGTRAAAKLLATKAADRPEAVFAGNDLTAFGLMHALTSHGVKVPEDVAIVGYDDIALAEQLLIPLTTVRQPAALLGMSAVTMVIDQISGQHTTQDAQHRLLKPQLIVRSSA